MGHSARITPWERMNISGKLLVQEICRQIDQADFFCADLTGINPNVLFELGYAIGRNKRIWLVLDSSLNTAVRDFNDLRVLTTVGHSKYHNSSDIVKHFYDDLPHESLEKTIFDEEIKPNLTDEPSNAVLYLKSAIDTEANMKISNFFRSSRITVSIDDPKESPSQSLLWYGQQVYSTSGVVCLFDHPDRQGAAIRHARQALVCGLALGLGKKVLMLAEHEYFAPIDYRDLMFNYSKANQAVEKLGLWLPNVTKEHTQWKELSKRNKSREKSNSPKYALKELKLGDYLAENEDKDLLEGYFLATTEYSEALEGKNRIFVGRKGTGKTATFIRLAQTFTRDRSNLVCKIQPLGYEIQQIVKLMHNYSENSQKSYVIESLWKFILYTEIANVIALELDSKKQMPLSESESELLDLLGTKDSILREEFAIRLERIAGNLSAKKLGDSIEATRYSITETLHKNELAKLRKLIGNVLNEKRCVRILIDNLDKAWTDQEDLNAVSAVLFGLLRATSKLQNEFAETHSGLKKIPMSLALFLRADIFYRIAERADEPDKFQHAKMQWSDSELLLKVIEERLAPQGDLSDVWGKYFCETIDNMATKDFFISRILPRPRDIVYLVKTALGNAIKHNRTVVEEKDIVEAEKAYSQYAIDSLRAEDLSLGGILETVLYEFMGAPIELDIEALCSILEKAGIEKEKIEVSIEQLCKLTFLGMETRKGEFTFIEDPADFKRIDALSKNLSRGKRRYQIYKAFHSYLQVSPSVS